MTNLSKPQHVAIIMDGNGRWAKQQGKARMWGHRAGAQSVRAILQAAAKQQIKALTVFAFSLENQNRPHDEVENLMLLFLESLQRYADELKANGVRFQLVGNRDLLSKKLLQQVVAVEQLTALNNQLIFSVAAFYSGKWDILQAAKKMAIEFKNNNLLLENVSEEEFADYLCFSNLPAVDMLIRTGGEQRISNFLLWQLAYAELYFTDVMWPDFDQDEFAKALDWFQTRQRRFGLTSEQVSV